MWRVVLAFARLTASTLDLLPSYGIRRKKEICAQQ